MAEAGVHVRFFKEPMLHAARSKEEGRQVFIDKDHVEIKVAGNDKEVFVGPVNDQIKARFPDEWDRYQKAGENVARQGTPVKEWPQLTPSQVRMLEGLNIYTVEDMATLSDAGVAKIGMGGQKMRADAQRFISLARTAADLEQMDELKAANDLLKQQVAELTAQMAELVKQAKPKKADKAAA